MTVNEAIITLITSVYQLITSISHLLLRFLRLSSLPLSLSLSFELEDDSDSDESESSELALPDSSDSETGFCCCMIRRGMFFRYSRRFSVIPHRPIDVKKLIENLVFFGLSLGKIDSKESCIVGSFSRSFSKRIPRCSDNSCSRKEKVCLSIKGNRHLVEHF